MIRICDRIAIDEREIEESFVRASGPGVQRTLTAPTLAARRRRLQAKSRRAAIKRLRAAPPPDD